MGHGLAAVADFNVAHGQADNTRIGPGKRSNAISVSTRSGGWCEPAFQVKSGVNSLHLKSGLPSCITAPDQTRKRSPRIPSRPWPARAGGCRRAPTEPVVPAIFADISIAQLALITGAALIASVIGGVSGYGTGALMPLVLVPILGPAPVVPIIALSSIFSNSGRAMAFRRLIDTRRVLIVLAGAVPTCVLGAWGYTLLSGRGAALVIGTMLALSVPLRRRLRRRGFKLSDRGLGAAAVGYGVAVGGTTGSGILLLSLLMAAGLQGANVIATDALISIIISFVKLVVFGIAGVMDAQAVAVALLIGAIALPGSYLAKLMVERMPVHVHSAILDAVVIVGGATMAVAAFAG